MEIRADDVSPSDFGAHEELAEALGVEAMLALMEARGGEEIYIPRLGTILKRCRDRIRAAGADA